MDNGRLSGKATSIVKVTKMASTNLCNVYIDMMLSKGLSCWKQ